MKIVIVDDDKDFLSCFERKIDAGFSKMMDCFEIKCLQTSFIHEEMDILFLDIEMNGLNGIEMIRSYSKDNIKQPLLIFVSSKTELVFDAMSVHPFYFIRKSFLDTDLAIFFQLIENYMVKNRKLLTIDCNGRKTSILHCDIIYIQSDGRYVHIFSYDDEFVYRETLKNFLGRIDNKNFVQIQKSLVINLDNVKEIIQGDIVLKSGEVFGVNRSYRTNLLTLYEEYLLSC
ncbi:LytR/AlgR family response regulator transcription factor [Tannockella kyphosi]|uniref:LytR/AlgR family response regulator transcription factor n=1 Tax=Tannockella kyphosi TaxID=2899121 RepID=UPI0020137AD2|nr:response regulator transcription factor [Tannockella kyphosi]